MNQTKEIKIVYSQNYLLYCLEFTYLFIYFINLFIALYILKKQKMYKKKTKNNSKSCICNNKKKYIY